jgi:hypothetical protein
MCLSFVDSNALLFRCKAKNRKAFVVTGRPISRGPPEYREGIRLQYSLSETASAFHTSPALWQKCGTLLEGRSCISSMVEARPTRSAGDLGRSRIAKAAYDYGQ